ncbi:chemotaxis protein [Agrobacterium larrymoorei]|uniref:Chemotaxis protein n=1 Tax=Agrobacterium larrymoorei TaxID=160699 RepID=A0AAF0HAF7_9HYPH|nr:chemotaxis protein [Agrobacterium larrymoorei]WHA40824.1 chemotaxis protein [Agrobacterium larrymoorei]
MMRATHIAALLMSASGLLGAGPSHAQSDLPPSKILRSLQFVQDSVVMGDHAARDMQKYLLETFDTTLRTSDPSIFSDSKNADAALAYIMSGGNPATLDYLVARDVQGYFDSRVINVLQKYFTGRGGQVEKVVADLIPEYQKNRLGPYLMLIAGNIAINRDPVASLAFFDDARLTAPGTIIEEAALRRSIAAAMQAKQHEKGLIYIRKYAVRFLHSPYAPQFADLLVSFTIENYGPVTTQDVEEIAELMDAERAGEVYLRIARQASLRGQVPLAQFATEKANALADKTGNKTREALSKLYSGLANVSSDAVQSASEALESIPADELSPRDLALRDAAKAIAEQIVQDPATSRAGNAAENQMIASGDDPHAPAVVEPVSGSSSSTQDAVPLKTFFDKNRARLNEIDSLLKLEER